MAYSRRQLLAKSRVGARHRPTTKKPRQRGRGKVVGVTGVTVTDRMLIDAGLSRQHRDSRNSIAVTFLQKPNLGHHSRRQLLANAAMAASRVVA